MIKHGNAIDCVITSIITNNKPLMLLLVFYRSCQRKTERAGENGH